MTFYQSNKNYKWIFLKEGISVIFFLLIGFNAFCQVTSPQLNYSVIPPSPDAASLGKFGDIPISLYTGTPSISIPLMSLESSLLSTSLSLTYDAKGIKVNDFASRVGIGWSLQAGGVVTRTVMGNPDEAPGGFYNWGANIPSNLAEVNAGTDYLRYNFNGNYDSESDIYYFSFNGRSGKFVKIGNEFRTIPYTKVDIQEPGLHGEGFILIDEQGNKYYFTAAEASTSSFSFTLAPVSEKSAWYLTKIVDPLGKDSIVFQYESHDYSLPTMLVSESKKRLSSPPPPLLPGGTPLPNFVNETNELDQFINGVLLKSVTANNWGVNFYYSSRTDIGDKKIDSISLETNSTVIKKFVFSYSTNGGKLILDSLSEYPKVGENLLRHKFEYYLKNQIQPVNSKGQDHWGYYNGADNNLSLVPTFTTYQGVQTGGDREPNVERAKVGILTKIIYPTGGSTSFEYESNEFASVNGKSIPDLQFKTVNKTAVAAAKYTTGAATANNTFSIAYPQWVTIHYTISNCNPNISGCQSPSHEPSTGLIQLTTTGNTIVDINGGVVDQEKNETFQTYLSIVGTYSLYVSAPGQYDNCYISVKYEEKIIDTTIKSITGGGLRIKKITNYDGVSSLNNTVRSYEYNLTDGSGISSGIIANLPKYDYSYTQYSIDNQSNPVCDAPYHYIVFTSNSTHPLGTTNGSYVGYQAVTEKFEGNNSSYKIVNYFTAANKYPDNISVQPFFPSTSYDCRRGLLIRKDYFDAAGNLVRQEKNGYTVDNSLRQEIVNLKVSQNTTCIASSQFANGTYFPESYNAGYYKYISEWIQLTSDTLTEFDNSSTRYITTIKQYEYDPNTLQQNKITTTDSRGDLSILTTTYPQAYLITGNPTNKIMSGIKALQDKHILSKKIETISYKVIPNIGTVVIGADLSTYDPQTLETDTVFNLLNIAGVSGFTNFSIGQNSTERDSRYFPNFNLVYNDKRKLSEIGKIHDQRTTYLWGYNSQYPVAKIVGTSYVTAVTKVSQSQIDAATNISNNDVNVQALLNTLRTIPGTLVTTYTYAPPIGITSQTDPSGKTIKYEYDSFGRLKTIRDQDNNVLKTMDYQYQQSSNQ